MATCADAAVADDHCNCSARNIWEGHQQKYSVKVRRPASYQLLDSKDYGSWSSGNVSGYEFLFFESIVVIFLTG